MENNYIALFIPIQNIRRMKHLDKIKRNSKYILTTKSFVKKIILRLILELLAVLEDLYFFKRLFQKLIVFIAASSQCNR